MVVWEESLAFSLFAVTNESLAQEMWSVCTEVDHNKPTCQVWRVVCK